MFNRGATILAIDLGRSERKIRVNTISGVLFFLGFGPYIWAILNHQTMPSPVSWTIWASVDTLVLVAMKKKKAVTGQLTGAVCGAWLITTLALVFGKPTMGLIEWVSVAGAVIGIVLWQKTGDAILAIICSSLALFVGSFPTFANAYRNPSQEDPVSWTIWTISCVFALLAIPKGKWDLANTLQPLTFMVVETTVFFLVVIRPLWL